VARTSDFTSINAMVRRRTFHAARPQAISESVLAPGHCMEEPFVLDGSLKTKRTSEWRR